LKYNSKYNAQIVTIKAVQELLKKSRTKR